MIWPDWEQRRLWLGWWLRLTRWEFWPAWAVYPPVAIYILWLGIRYRSPLLFTAVNPGMPTSGFVPFPKSLALEKLQDGPGSRHPRVARFIELPSRQSVADRLSVLVNFQSELAEPWPLVLKPECGERGAGVTIARSHQQAHEFLVSCPHDAIAQEYVPGVEYGVFYIRRPDQRTGSIFAITDKRFPIVEGDGQLTLRELILTDDRAVCMAHAFLASHTERLDSVPVRGEAVRLIELGTHSRGALFLEGIELVTPELTAAIDAVSQNYAGFFFGRYDVRAASPESFQSGEFKIIELNGVTSEATSMYDPRYSIWHAWSVLCRQWRIAFEIAHENRAKGAKVMTSCEFYHAIAGFFSRKSF